MDGWSLGPPPIVTHGRSRIRENRREDGLVLEEEEEEEVHGYVYKWAKELEIRRVFGPSVVGGEKERKKERRERPTLDFSLVAPRVDSVTPKTEEERPNDRTAGRMTVTLTPISTTTPSVPSVAVPLP